MSDHPENSLQTREDRIRAIAYALWEDEGRPDGHDQDHWLRACELVDAQAVADPDWLQRTEAQVAAEAETAPETSAEPAKKASLDDLVKRMKGGRAA
jgi:hypothetical protein